MKNVQFFFSNSKGGTPTDASQLLQHWNGFLPCIENKDATQQESGLSTLDHTAITTAIQNSGKKRKNYRVIDNERYVIG